MEVDETRSSFFNRKPKVMKNALLTIAFASAVLAATCLSSGEANAQCATCVTPQVAYTPVSYNSYYDGWYPGKYLGRATRRVFGVAPAPAYSAGYAAAYPTTYAAAYPTTYAASYAPTYATSYAPGCSTCGTSPCGCQQTTFRPVIMQPVAECNTCCYAPATCSTCSGVTQAAYDAPAASCPTCNSAPASTHSSPQQPSLPSSPAPAPQQTFRETDKLNPTPANESSFDEQNADWEAPQLLDPNDRLTKRPTAPVWTAVYKKQSNITPVKASTPTAKPKKTIGWTSGR